MRSGFKWSALAVVAGLPLFAYTSSASAAPAIYNGTAEINALQDNDVNLGNILDYERTQPWTVGVAVNTSHLPTEAAVIFSNVPSTGGPYPGYELWVNPSGELEVRLIHDVNNSLGGGVNMIDVHTNTSIVDGTFHYIYATYDGSSTAAGVKIYVDGAAQADTVVSDTLTGTIVGTGSDASQTQSFVIGSQQGRDADFYFGGLIDAFNLSDTVRSAAYIAANSDAADLPPVDAFTQLYLNFDEGAGLTTADSSGNGYTGTLTSASMWVVGDSTPVAGDPPPDPPPPPPSTVPEPMSLGLFGAAIMGLALVRRRKATC